MYYQAILSRLKDAEMILNGAVQHDVLMTRNELLDLKFLIGESIYLLEKGKQIENRNAKTERKGASQNTNS